MHHKWIILPSVCLLFYLTPTRSLVRRRKRSISNDVTTPDTQYNSTVDPCLVDLVYLPDPETYETNETESTAASYLEDYDVTTTEIPDEFYKSFSDEFLTCFHMFIREGCYEFQNESVFIPMFNVTFNESNYYVEPSGILRICPDVLRRDEVDSFQVSLTIVSLVGVGVSAICVAVHVIIFLSVPEMRNLPGYCLFSLCVALLVAYICSLVPLALFKDEDCHELGLIMYYFFMSSFFWMNLISYDVWRALRLATAKLRTTKNRPILLRFGLYSLYSWGSPMVILAIAFIIDNYASVNNKYKILINQSTCWFEHKQALSVYFAFPLFALACANTCFFISSSFMICSHSMRSSEGDRGRLWSRFFASLRLAVVMGLTWIFGMQAAMTEVEALWYLYAVFTGFQGVFIFFGFTFKDKVKKAVMEFFRCQSIRDRWSVVA